MTLSTIQYDTTGHLTEWPDWAAIVGLDVDLSARVGMRLETMVANKGYALARGGIAARYVELPILVRYRAVAQEGVAPYVSLGIAPSWQMRCRSYRSVLSSSIITGTGWTRYEAPCPRGLLDGPDVGVVLAVGLAAPGGRLRWRSELRYSHGMANLATAPAYGVRRSRSVALVLGVSWEASARARRLPN